MKHDSKSQNSIIATYMKMYSQISFLIYFLISSFHCLIRSLFLSHCTLSETILESPGQSLHVPHPSSTYSTPSLGFLSPVVIPHLLIGVSAGRAGFLLDVEGNLSATTAGCVRLVVSLSE
jgi:hypothetical protein